MDNKNQNKINNTQNCTSENVNSPNKVVGKNEKFKKPFVFDKLAFLSYSIAFLVASLTALAVANSGGVFDNLPKRRLYAVLSDAFFVPGGLFVCFSVLLKIASGGFFDGVSFIFKRVFNSLIPGARIKKEQNYVDYKKSKDETRKKGDFTSILVVGIIFTLIAILFLVLYSNT